MHFEPDGLDSVKAGKVSAFARRAAYDRVFFGDYSIKYRLKQWKN
jgi:hypothetical protein